MIGRIKNISKFGLFVDINRQTGLLRWSNLTKGQKFQSGDLIAVDVVKSDNGKLELALTEQNFQEIFGTFIEKTRENLEILKEKNQEIR